MDHAAAAGMAHLSDNIAGDNAGKREAMSHSGAESHIWYDSHNQFWRSRWEEELVFGFWESFSASPRRFGRSMSTRAQRKASIRRSRRMRRPIWPKRRTI